MSMAELVDWQERRIADLEAELAGMTNYGFNFGPMVIERLAHESARFYALMVKVGKHRVEIVASPKGRNIYVRQYIKKTSEVRAEAAERSDDDGSNFLSRMWRRAISRHLPSLSRTRARGRAEIPES